MAYVGGLIGFIVGVIIGVLIMIKLYREERAMSEELGNYIVKLEDERNNV